MSSPNRRRDLDLTKLMMSGYEVTMSSDSLAEFSVNFHGPKDSPYVGGVWKVRVELPPNYPYKSPSIGFSNKIYHPNVDFASGSVCLDVINQTWSPMFDPLNGEAAALALKEPEKYKLKVQEYVQKYATENATKEEDDDESDLSSYSSDSDDNMDDDETQFPFTK